VLVFEPAATEPEDEPAVADVIDRRRDLRGEPRVPQRVCGDEHADPRPLRDGGDGRQRGPALELRRIAIAFVVEQVIVDPKVVGTGGLRGANRVPK